MLQRLNSQTLASMAIAVTITTKYWLTGGRFPLRLLSSFAKIIQDYS